MAPRAGHKRTTTPAPAPAPANPAPPGHNVGGPLTQDDMDDLFLIHLAQARKDNDALEAAMEIVRGVRKGRARNRNLCKTDGFPLSELDIILKDELLPRHDVEEREEKRLRMRGIAKQPGGSLEQGDLFNDSFSQHDKDKEYWAGHGFTEGLRGSEQDPGKHGVPGEFQQDWLQSWHSGQERLAKAWATKTRIDGGAAPETPAEPETDPGNPPGEEEPAGDEQPSETDGEQP